LNEGAWEPSPPKAVGSVGFARHFTALSLSPKERNPCQPGSLRLAINAEAPPGTGFLIDPESLGVLCLVCAFPDESERERVATDAIRELMRRFESEQGRRTESIREFVEGLRSRETPKPYPFPRSAMVWGLTRDEMVRGPSARPQLVVVASAAHCAAQRPQYPEDHTHHDQDDADYPKDAGVEYRPEDQTDNAEDDQWVPPTVG
jgi:hypothetical protein